MNSTTPIGEWDCPTLEHPVRDDRLAGNQNELNGPLIEIHEASQGDSETTNDRLFAAADRTQLMEIKAMVTKLLETSKPILTVKEAAEMLSISPKRLKNIIYQEKTRLGNLPDFVCDASGILGRRILRDPLLDWVKRRRRKGTHRTKSSTRGRAAT